MLSCAYCSMQLYSDPEGKGKILGGCVTVAGWGQHHDVWGHWHEKSRCLTDSNPLSPDKAA